MNFIRRAAIPLWIAFLIVCAWITAHAHYTADLSAFLPRSPTPTQQILVDQLREGVVSQMLLVEITDAPTEQLAAISNDLVEHLDNSTQFAYVNNGDTKRFLNDGKILFQQRYLLSPGVTPQRFTVEGLRDALENDLDLLSSSLSSMVSQSLPSDPTGEFTQLLDKFQPQGGPQKKSGVWFSHDGQSALLILQTRAAGFNLGEQQHALENLQQQFSTIIQQHHAPTATLVVTGSAVIALSTQQAMKRDVSHISLLALLLVSILLLSVYRSPRILILTLLPVASGALAGIAVVSKTFGFVHGITLGFGSTLLGEGVDYAIYLFTQHSGDPAKCESTKPESRGLWRTLRLGVMTSVVGYSVLLMSDFSGLAQLGLFSIVGLVVAFAVTRLVLPKLIPPGFTATTATTSGPSLIRGANALRVLRWPMIAAVLFALFSLFNHHSLWDDRLESLSPVSSKDKQLDNSLRAELGAPDVGPMVVVRAPSQQAALQMTERVDATLDQLQQDHVLRGYESPAMLLPSDATQRQRQAALPDVQLLQHNLQQALIGLPYQPGLFTPFLHDVEAAKHAPLLTENELRGTSLGLKVESLLAYRHDAWFALLPLRGVTDADRIAHALDGMPNVHLLNMKQEADLMFKDYRHQAMKFISVGAFAVILLLFATLRSLRRVLEVLLPLAAAVIITMAIMTLGGRQLTMFHLIGLMLVVGVGSNYTLFFERQTFSSIDPYRTIVSVVLCNIATIIGFAMLSLAHAPVLSSIGLTVAIGAFLCLLIAIVFGNRVTTD